MYVGTGETVHLSNHVQASGDIRMANEDTSEDSLTFIRQRRNVMFAALVVLAVLALNVQYGAFKLFGASAASPENYDVAWAALIWYFTWRLFQCGRPANFNSKPLAYYKSYLQQKLSKTKFVEEYRQKALGDCNAELKQGGPTSVITGYGEGKSPTTETFQISSVDFDSVMNLTVTKKTIGYVLQYKIVLNTNSVQMKLYPFEMKRHEMLPVYSWVRAHLMASWRDEYFSEYLLPYWLGFGTIFYCCYHHLIVS